MLKELWSTYYFDGMNFRSFVVYSLHANCKF